MASLAGLLAPDELPLGSGEYVCGGSEGIMVKMGASSSTGWIVQRRGSVLHKLDVICSGVAIKTLQEHLPPVDASRGQIWSLGGLDLMSKHDRYLNGSTSTDISRGKRNPFNAEVNRSFLHILFTPNPYSDKIANCHTNLPHLSIPPFPNTSTKANHQQHRKHYINMTPIITMAAHQPGSPPKKKKSNDIR